MGRGARTHSPEVIALCARPDARLAPAPFQRHPSEQPADRSSRPRYRSFLTPAPAGRSIVPRQAAPHHRAGRLLAPATIHCLPRGGSLVALRRFSSSRGGFLIERERPVLSLCRGATRGAWRDGPLRCSEDHRCSASSRGLWREVRIVCCHGITSLATRNKGPSS